MKQIFTLLLLFVVGGLFLRPEVAAQVSDPVIVAAGDIACASVGNPGSSTCQQVATSNLLLWINPTAVLPLGDTQYPDGILEDFNNFYHPSWGKLKAITYPAPGNHEYHVNTSRNQPIGGTGYFDYFGRSVASPLDTDSLCNTSGHPECKGYYSYNLGNWYIIALNSEKMSSTQTAWLEADLQANQVTCTLAYMHHPRWSSGAVHGSSTRTSPFWDLFYQYKVDVVLAGHDHQYERFAKQDPSGVAKSDGVRQFLVGSGGSRLYAFGTPIANSEFRYNADFGVIKMTLQPASYNWQFIRSNADHTVIDSGSDNCVGGTVVTITPGFSPTPTSASFSVTPTRTPTLTQTLTPTPTNTRTPTPVQASVSPTPIRTSTPIPSPTGGLNSITINFSPSTEDFANPERGFMKQSSIFPDQPFDANKVRALQSSDSVVWIYFRLDNYRDPRDGVGVILNDYQCQAIDSTGLSRINQTFETARSRGLKLVYRFIYNFGPGSTTDPSQANPDVPIECVRQHLDQLTPLMVANMDVTVAVQAGFVGHWGEWHSSKYLQDIDIRREIVNTLLTIVPQDKMVMIRYPNFKELFYGGPLTDAEAFSGTNSSRVGHHNDCFLRDDDDTTYRSKRAGYTSDYCSGLSGQVEIDCWKNFVAQEGRYTPIGGETCQYNPPRTDCPNAIAEMEMLHWSFINNDYQTEVLDGWKSQGCWDTIRLRLGYRFGLSKLTLSHPVAPGGMMSFRLELENKGFASPFNTRPVLLVLRNNATDLQREITLSQVDPRGWKPGLVIVDLSVLIPADLPTGTYSVYLWMPDPDASLRSLSEYAVRLANQDVWQASTGYNLLTGELSVSGSVPVPGDINGDGKVDSQDYMLLLSLYGTRDTTADFNRDEFVNILDYVILSINYATTN